MKIYTILLTAILGAVVAFGPGDISDQAPPPTSDDASTRNYRALPPEPPSSVVDIGDLAPNFAYQGEDNRWRRLRDLLQQGPALLVFGADAATLTAIDRDRDAMLKAGTVPVALLEMRNSVAWATARRLGLRYVVIPDSRRVIATQFHALDATGERTAPAWFVVDRSCRVRAMRRGGLPTQGFAKLAAGALGQPEPETGVPAEKRR